jgi:non-specific serine/threonine protein kinase
MGSAVARWWGLDDAVLHMIRRLNPVSTVRNADSDDDVLRAVGSAANEAIDALALPASRQAAAVERVAQRYARVLGLTPSDMADALHASASHVPPPIDAQPAAA